MSAPTNKNKGMFDILPGSGSFNIEPTIHISLSEEVPLSSGRADGQTGIDDIAPIKETGIVKNQLDELVSEVLEGDLSEHAKKEVEAVIAGTDDPVVELAKAGAVIGRLSDWTSRLKTKEGITEAELPHFKSATSHRIIRKQVRSVVGTAAAKEPDLERILSVIREPVSPRVAFMAARPRADGIQLVSATTPVFKKVMPLAATAPEAIGKIKNEIRLASAEAEIVSFYTNAGAAGSPVKNAVLGRPEIPSKKENKKLLNFAQAGSVKKHKAGFWIFSLVIAGVLIYGLTLKNEIIRGGNSAFNNLEQAGESLKSLNFGKASENFGRSYEDFSEVSQTLSFVGAGLADFFYDIPGIDKLGLGQVKAAKDIAEAGKLMAESGQAMSRALASLSQAGSILNPADSGVKPSKIISKLKDALYLSNENFKEASALILAVDGNSLPEDKKQKLEDFKSKIPLLEEYLGSAIKYSEFLEGVIGMDKPRKYLLLFQNNSELRPTGGFPGTYGVVSFASGGLSDFFVNDVYNLDGQIKRNVIPPKALQHITPTWGMRDSAWFIDFPVSARKAMAFFSELAGYKVNGVITVNPDIVSGILDVIGPIEMPEYKMTLNADNFLESIQEEVEYGDNRKQPKQVVSDFAPRFLAKLYSADADQWMKIFNVFMAGMEEKDILFYFDDKDLEKFAVDQGYGGEVKRTQADYLMINFSNVKGSKTDAVTDSSVSIDTRFEEDLGRGKVIHKISVSRTHRGGDHEHGFYNRQNPAYVRVLIPEGAELLSISGNDIPKYKSLINYSGVPGFESDAELKKLESTFFADKFPGVEKYYEPLTGGEERKGIAFWMVTDPRTTKRVEFEYAVPFEGKEYDFYFQKQPGMDWKNFKLKVMPSDGYSLAEADPKLNKIGSAYIFEELLKKDFSIKLKFK